MILGGIEAGGTKIICATSDIDINIIKKIEIPTESPEKTLPKIIEFFEANKVDLIGIGSFGPININPESENYGMIGNTPKSNWKGFDYTEALSSLKVPLFVTTDVNAAAYGEFHADKNINSCFYFTVGTGVGGGYVDDEKVLTGMTHPEIGHMVIRKHEDDKYAGYCVFHQDCLEGLACGPSIFDRTGIEGKELSSTNQVFEFLSYYLAQAAHNITLLLSPSKIVFGGGVLQKEGLIESIRQEFKEIMADYIEVEYLDKYITKPILGSESGIKGCLLYGRDQYFKKTNKSKTTIIN